MSIAARLSSSIALLLALLAVLFGILFNQNIEQSILAGEEQTFRLLFGLVGNAIDDELEYLRGVSLGSPHSDEVLTAFAARDRDALLRIYEGMLEAAAPRITRIHFHLPDGTSFLRVHDPDRFGDDLARIRPMVRTAVESRAPADGIEFGTNGAGFRRIIPIEQDGEFLGALEFGSDFGGAFLQSLKDRYGGEYFIRLLDPPPAFPELVAGTLDSDRCVTDQPSLERIRLGESFWVTTCEQTRGVGFVPFAFFDGEIGGYVKIELDRLDIVEKILLQRQRLSLVGILVIAAVSIAAFFMLKKMLVPLRAIVEQTQRISKQILSGNLQYRGDVSETVADFRPVITEINTIISTLREREAILRAIVEGIPGVVYFCDTESRVLWANQRALDAAPGIIGARLESGFDGRVFFSREGELHAQARATGRIAALVVCSIEEAAKRPDIAARGEPEQCWEHTAVPVLGIDGTVQNIIRISQDITETRRFERELRRLNEHLEQRVNEELAKRRDQEKMVWQQSRLASIGELAAGIAHEINQPLNTIAFGIENIAYRFDANGLDTAYLAQKIDQINGDIERIRRIIGHVRLFARDMPGEYRIPFSVRESVGSALDLLAPQLKDAGIETAVEIAPDLPEVYGNPYQFEQVILNIVGNSCDAIALAARAGLIRITADRADACVRVRIVDNGTGIPSEYLDRVLDPFFSTKPTGRGTGLGLSISFGIIKGMNGEVAIESEPGKTVVTITVPVSESSAVSAGSSGSV